MNIPSSSYIKYALFVATIVIIAGNINPGIFHWFIIPILLSAAVISTHFLSWFHSKDIFEIKGFVGLFNFYYFVISPLFYIVFKGQMTSVVEVKDDWRFEVGVLSAINFIGLIIFTYLVNYFSVSKVTVKKHWKLTSNSKFRLVLFILITGVFTVVTFARFGGIAGLFSVYNSEDADLSNASLFTILSYPFPLLLFFYFILFRPGLFKSNIISILLLASVFVLQLLISGAGGARGNFAFAFFWSLMIYHYFIKRISRNTVIIGSIPLIFFFWLFSFYKSLKLDALVRLQNGESIFAIASDANRGLESIFWGDMSRINIHSYMAYKFLENADYDLRYGSTYIEAFYPIIPFWIWEDRPLHSGKVVAGTELIWGKGFYTNNTAFFSSNAYGITGEAALNFGLYGFLLGFVFWGLIVGWMAGFYNSLDKRDYRAFVYPFLLWWAFNLFLWDSDNYLAHNITKSVLILIIIYTIFGRKTKTIAHEGERSAGV